MNELAEEIKARVDIVDLISEYVDLKRAGQNYKGLCPFHPEKTPSFIVSPSKQIFHCFGCHRGGNIFNFLMDYEKMSFRESLSYLAQKAGIRIENINSRNNLNKGLKESLYEIYKQTEIFYKENLKNSKQAISYLNERGLDSETIERFGIGYSRNEIDSLFKRLQSLDFSLEHIKASGLVYFGQKGVYDFFRNRLMFPIYDLQSRVIAFGGRTMSSSKEVPKYINSPDSFIFKKGELFYGLHMAKNFINQKGYVIIVEGYMDVITCHQHGFYNVVAPLGTALTSGQLRRLKRFCNNVLLVFDGDSAGVSATKRAIENCYAEGINVKILLMPPNQDPDSFIRRYGEDGFRRYMAKTNSPIEFLLKISGKSRLDAVRSALHAISLSPDRLQQEDSLRELSERSRINEITLRDELKSIRDRKIRTEEKKYTKIATNQNIDNISPQIKKEEEILLNIIFSAPLKAKGIIESLDCDLIEDPLVRGIFEKIRDVILSNSSVTLESLLSTFNNEEQRLITRLLLNYEIDTDLVDKTVEDCLMVLKLREIERQIKLAGDAGNIELLNSLLKEKMRIKKNKF